MELKHKAQISWWKVNELNKELVIHHQNAGHKSTLCLHDRICLFPHEKKLRASNQMHSPSVPDMHLCWTHGMN